MEKFIDSHHEFVEGSNVPEKVKPKETMRKTSTTLSVKGSVMNKTQSTFRK